MSRDYDGPISSVGYDALVASNGYDVEGYGVFPDIITIFPDMGYYAIFTPVTITGSNFVTGATVQFNGNWATNVIVVNPTTITCNAPPHALGWVDVQVTNPDGNYVIKFDGFGYYVAYQDYAFSNSHMLIGLYRILTPPPIPVINYPTNNNLTLGIETSNSGQTRMRRGIMQFTHFNNDYALTIPPNIIGGCFLNSMYGVAEMDATVNSVNVYNTQQSPAIESAYYDTSTPLFSIPRSSFWPLFPTYTAWWLSTSWLHANIGQKLQFLFMTDESEGHVPNTRAVVVVSENSFLRLFY